MKDGLCGAIARERSIAGEEGYAKELIADKAAVFVLDTNIDLAGTRVPSG